MYKIKYISIVMLVNIIYSFSGCSMLSNSEVHGNYHRQYLLPISKIFSKEECLLKKIDNTYVECHELITPTPIVSVSSLPVATNQAPQLNVTNLSDHGQEVYIKNISNEATAKGLLKLFSSNSELKPIDLTVVSRTFYVTVEEPFSIAPADRLTKSKVWIDLDKISGSQVYFLSWDQAVTTYTTINAGTIQNQRIDSSELDSQLSTLPVSALGAGQVTSKISQQNQHTESLNVNPYAESLNVSLSCINPARGCGGELGRLLISKHSLAGGQPLSGNTQVTIKLKLVDELSVNAVSLTTQCVGTDAGKPISTCANGNNIKIQSQDVKLPHSLAIKELKKTRGLMAKVKVQYELRHVQNGGDTVQEADDDVVYNQYESDDLEVNILPLFDVPEYYGIYQKTSTKEALPIIATYDAARDREGNRYVCYPSVGDATNFLSYANKKILAGNLSIPEEGISIIVKGSNEGLNKLFYKRGCGVSS